jgi:phosphate transport system permease protein
MSGVPGTPIPQPNLPGRPRNLVLRKITEGGILASLGMCGLFSVLTTLAIILTLGTDGARFFTGVPGRFEGVGVGEFLGGLRWSPLLGGEKHFGIWPLIVGTLMVTAVAMLLAGPLGVITAIWLSEYAPLRVRGILKPVLEVIAGIPTVVLGFFALTVITPTLRFAFIQVPAVDAAGRPLLGSDGSPITQPLNPFNIEIYNVLSAGIAVGILSLPVVTSLAEDALRAVPRSLREGSYGLGATRFETSIKVVFPAALSGIIAAFLLAIARCVGETMIVALAAGGSVAPLHQIVDPPLEVHVWEDLRAPAAGASLARIEPESSWKSPGFTLGNLEKVDEIEITARSSAPGTTIRLQLLRPDGTEAASTTLALEGAPGADLALAWQVPADKSGPARDAERQARDYGIALPAGRYHMAVTPSSSAVDLVALRVEGERTISLAQRAAIPFDVRKSMQPMTGYLVQIFLGDVSNLGIEYYSSYAVAGILFLLTFLLTIIGQIIRVRFQQQYD